MDGLGVTELNVIVPAGSVTLRTEREWDEVLDYLARDDERKLGGPELPKRGTPSRN